MKNYLKVINSWLNYCLSTEQKKLKSFLNACTQRNCTTLNYYLTNYYEWTVIQTWLFLKQQLFIKLLAIRRKQWFSFLVFIVSWKPLLYRRDATSNSNWGSDQRSCIKITICPRRLFCYKLNELKIFIVVLCYFELDGRRST